MLGTYYRHQYVFGVSVTSIRFQCAASCSRPINWRQISIQGVAWLSEKKRSNTRS